MLFYHCILLMFLKTGRIFVNVLLNVYKLINSQMFWWFVGIEFFLLSVYIKLQVVESEKFRVLFIKYFQNGCLQQGVSIFHVNMLSLVGSHPVNMA